MSWLNLLSIIIGPVSALAGVIVGERYRRREQRLVFGGNYLEKKSEIYEELWRRISQSRSAWSDALTPTSTVGSIKEQLGPTILSLAHYLDENSLYIHENISANAFHILLTSVNYPALKLEQRDAFKKNADDKWEKVLSAMKEDLGYVRIEKELSSLGPVSRQLTALTEYSKLFGPGTQY